MDKFKEKTRDEVQKMIDEAQAKSLYNDIAIYMAAVTKKNKNDEDLIYEFFKTHGYLHPVPYNNSIIATVKVEGKSLNATDYCMYNSLRFRENVRMSLESLMGSGMYIICSVEKKYGFYNYEFTMSMGLKESKLKQETKQNYPL